MAKFYAWSDIKGGTLEHPIAIERGDEVTQADLKVKDEDWQALIDGGSIRNKPHPAPKGYQGSGVDYLREALQDATAMSAVDEEEAASELAKVVEPQTESASRTTISTKSRKK